MCGPMEFHSDSAVGGNPEGKLLPEAGGAQGHASRHKRQCFYGTQGPLRETEGL
jgi:hypothetical protein